MQVATSKSGTHTVILCNNGQVYTFGTSACGALGVDLEFKENIDPRVEKKNENRTKNKRLYFYTHIYRYIL